MEFFLGTHQPGWLWRDDLGELTGTGQRPPLFVSRRRLAPYRQLRPAAGDWAMDSGGFTELHQHGRWEYEADAYVALVRRAADEIGRLRWAATMDWMVEPSVRTVTRQTVDRHQQRTVASYLQLRDAAAELPWAPVLQGWDDTGGRHPADSYLRCWERYSKAGIDLTADDVPAVGVGSVCRRQGTDDAHRIVAALAREGLAGRLHLFGAKITGVRRYAPLLASADSLAWSFDARYADPLAGCTHQACNNCPVWACRWWAKVVASASVSEDGVYQHEPEGPDTHRDWHVGLPEPPAGAAGWLRTSALTVEEAEGLASAETALCRPLAPWEQAWLTGTMAAAGLGPESLPTLAQQLPARPALPDWADPDVLVRTLAAASQVARRHADSWPGRAQIDEGLTSTGDDHVPGPDHEQGTDQGQDAGQRAGTQDAA